MGEPTHLKAGSELSSSLEQKGAEAAGAIRRRTGDWANRAGERDPRAQLERAAKERQPGVTVPADRTPSGEGLGG